MALQHLSTFTTPLSGAPTAMYADADAVGDAYYPSHCLMSFLERREGSGRPLAWRSGLPPAATGHVTFVLPGKDDHHDAATAHHHRARRRSDESVERLRYDMHDFLKSMVWANHDMLRLRASQLEGPQTKAVYIRDDSEDAPGFGFGFGPSAAGPYRPSQPMPAWLRHTGGENLHIHPDGSSHMLLSLADATTAVECGWAERPEAGCGSGYGYTYATVHAPRDRAELTEWKQLVLASVRYCTHAWKAQEVRRPERL